MDQVPVTSPALSSRCNTQFQTLSTLTENKDDTPLFCQLEMDNQAPVFPMCRTRHLVRLHTLEGRKIISNLSKVAGRAHMISTMRLDHADDEYVGNTTARAFSVVALALRIPALQFSPSSRLFVDLKNHGKLDLWVSIAQQIAIMMGCAVLPHLRNLGDCIAHGLSDEQQKVRTTTALGLAALAEASAPYGMESSHLTTS